MIGPENPLYDWGGLNTKLFLVLNEMHTPVFDQCILLTTWLGHPQLFPFYITFALLLTLRKPEKMPRINVVVFALSYVVISMFLVPIVKALFDFPRPLVVLGAQAVTILGEPDAMHSFPSGHSAYAVLMAASLAPGVHRWGKMVLVSFAVLVCVSRVLVGAHFPADVLGGVMLASTVVFALRLIIRLIYRIEHCDSKGMVVGKANLSTISHAANLPISNTSLNRNGLRGITFIMIAYTIATAITALAAALSGAPFVLWFKDTMVLMLAATIYIGVLGVVWDGLLIGLGLVSETISRFMLNEKTTTLTVASMRKFRFFTCGLSPFIMIVVTVFVLLGTSNITLLNLDLLGIVTQWRDPFFWKLEGSLIQWMISFPVSTKAWDTLYHSAWGIELFAAFVLILMARGPKIVLHYCLSLIMLFYFGRFLGILNPVMGPAFFRPELFGHLAGSVTETAMRSVSDIMAITPEEASLSGGLLLGGVSAMPSLHVGMVALTSYWLAIVKRWTLFMTVPWVLLVWTATVVLGWHYILDGVGGVLLGAVCILVTHRLLGTLREKGGVADMPKRSPSQEGVV